MLFLQQNIRLGQCKITLSFSVIVKLWMQVKWDVAICFFFNGKPYYYTSLTRLYCANQYRKNNCLFTEIRRNPIQLYYLGCFTNQSCIYIKNVFFYWYEEVMMGGLVWEQGEGRRKCYQLNIICISK